jgi:uncharacterized protein (TIGR03084 family)
VTELVDVLADLRAEGAEVDRLVSGLTDEQWALPTPAPGWTVAHQIAHLSWTDDQVAVAASDPAGFFTALAGLLDDPENLVDRGAEATLAPPAQLLIRWRDSRARVARALTAMPAGTRHPWFGTEMSALSSATGRLMETWAHGEDIAAAVGISREPTSRLRHVAFLGYRTLGHSFRTHGRPAPEDGVYLELTAPDGGTWAYGSPNAQNRVVGPALDFCLLVTRRTHRADTALAASGPVADEWLDIAQAFAGPPGPGRPPLGSAATSATVDGG